MKLRTTPHKRLRRKQSAVRRRLTGYIIQDSERYGGPNKHGILSIGGFYGLAKMVLK